MFVLLAASPARAVEDAATGRRRTTSSAWASRPGWPGRLDEALEHYRKAQQADPGSADLRTEMARLLREAGQTTQALAEAREAVPLDRDNVDAQEFLAEVLRLEAMRGGGAAVALEAAAALRGGAAPAPGRRPGHARPGRRSIGRRGGPRTPPASGRSRWRRTRATWTRCCSSACTTSRRARASAPQATLQKALEVEPGSSARRAGAWRRSTRRREQTEQAILHYRKALELEPRQPARAAQAGRPAAARAPARRKRWPRPTPCWRPTPRTASRSTSRAARCATCAATTRRRRWPSSSLVARTRTT